MSDHIVIRGARQHNLKNLSLDIPLRELVVVTGVSGSGKSSLVFDTLYAEGQRRYVETFSPYARQFLDRMDKPHVERIEGIPPAIAIDQTNPVRTSRSTVGTMTELADYLKVLFARASALHCRGCSRKVRRDTPQTIFDALWEASAAAGHPRLVVTFPLAIPDNFDDAEVLALLSKQGYTRIHAREDRLLHVVQDRFRIGSAAREESSGAGTAGADRARIVEALEAALRMGRGRVDVHVQPEADAPEGIAGKASSTRWRFSSDLHCPDCDLHYAEPAPSAFSFNSPLGACDRCRGFGRVIDIDFGLVVPDTAKTLRDGAVKPWQSPSFRECQDDLVKYAKKRGIPLDVPWRDLDDTERRFVLEGEPAWVDWKRSWPGTWYGVRRFFAWLETKSYKMHIRVLLSKYRAYTPCEACGGTRLKPDALLWRLGTHADAARGTPGASTASAALRDEAASPLLPGLTIHDVALLPIDRAFEFFEGLVLPSPLDEASDLLLREIRTRLSYLRDVGLGYLTLDRQSRTLSGGEVQRINLTTALGTSLVNTLFVLDEPSIGLHPRDMERVIGVMRRLRDAGNSLVVVEHDPQVMLAADRVLDIGPGPGERGGEIVFFGTPRELVAERRSLTADYLAGRKRIEPPAPCHGAHDTDRIEILGASEHNLKNADVAIPLRQLVCVTGVSGSGKSTLVQHVLHAALLRAKGRPTEAPGAHRALVGAELVDDVVLVDQAPIGRTTRSNPASYVGAFDAIRRRFAATPLARERSYTAGTFSFNAGTGRCPGCGGNGFEHVEMQFLSDVYLRCGDCDGRRYRAEVLDVALDGRSIADVLDLTVAEARAFFAGDDEIERALQPLVDVGLDYLRLGQPVPTLSGGEAQRLKLAGFLDGAAKREASVRSAGARRRAGLRKAARAASSQARRGGTLFLFDEPTTGLHFDDVARLLGAFRKLIDAGHSLLVIEHNLDVIRASDWIVDLGPEGGDAGGAVVVAGSVETVRGCAASHTGRALAAYDTALATMATPRPVAGSVAPFPSRAGGATRASREIEPAIHVHHAREHNLKGIDVRIPRDRFTVITGVSGSGKSTLAFDILFGEGQRRYLESLNAYARQFVQPASRPDVDAIFGIPPTVAIEQRASRGGRTSTVATLTELYHFLRLLYVKIGVQHCPDDGTLIAPQSEEAIAATVLREFEGRRVALLAPLVVARKGYYTDLAKWAARKGFEWLRVDGAMLPTARWPRLDRFKEHSIELPVADVGVSASDESPLRTALASALAFGKGVVHVLPSADRDTATAPVRAGERRRRGRETVTPSVATNGARVFSTRRACPACSRGFADPDPRLLSFNSKHGWCPSCFGTGLELEGFDAEQSGDEAWWNEWYEGDARVCRACEGTRLNREALAVRVRGRSIADITRLSVQRAAGFLAQLDLQGREADIARDIAAELASRLAFLDDVGLGYLALDRSAPTLSGGEAQRIRLAAQLGSNLRGVCYILDEPTIGLHPRDNRILLDTLAKLQAKGNTLVVVEHDEDTIRRADHVIDLGPGAGSRGGMLVAEGSAAQLMRSPVSVTGRFLAHPLAHPLVTPRETSERTPAIVVTGARLHNLHGIDVRVPLGRLTAVTGVSGSGKSTLARDVLYANLRERVTERRRRKAEPFACKSVSGFESLERVLEVDQTPIGKTPRSCPATYVGFWDAIRRLYAETTEARMRGFTASRFSFNTAGGRCPECEGQGQRKIEMSFLPDVKVVCEACRGARFNAETLAATWRGRSIADVLAMSVDDAVDFFAAHRSIHHALRLLQDVGLGYLTLGQQSPTLSGGEAQRIKLVTELAKVSTIPRSRGRVADVARRGRTLYVLDEPTVGLHMADVEKLIRVLHRLVEAGNTVVVIEHNLDVTADADWIVVLGPPGGDAGGRVVAQGTVEAITKRPAASHTARVLAQFLATRRAQPEARAVAAG
jgi:excinuclease ABC subunit A